MRVLVTGGAGYIGSRLSGDLLSYGHEVTVFDSLVYGGQSLLSFIGNKSFRFAPGDIRDSSALQQAIEGKDAIVHLAAVVGDQACNVDKVAAEKINRDAAVTALQVAQVKGVERFVFFSTCSNYGVSSPNVLADEDSELRPLSLYARTKVDVEKTILQSRHELTATVLRLGTICGVSARMRFDLLINEMARDAALGRRIEIYKPQAWRPFLHVCDVGPAVEAILQADSQRVNRRVFNVVGENHKKSDLIALASRHFPDADIRVTDGQPDDRDYRVSGARIERELGFKPLRTIESAFVETARAVADGLFSDPLWAGHGAVPLSGNALV